MDNDLLNGRGELIFDRPADGRCLDNLGPGADDGKEFGHRKSDSQIPILLIQKYFKCNGSQNSLRFAYFLKYL
ncbi:hypothetical protein ACFPMF_24860 [Larkinella bovis]|uniref:Uncharacterized protein n=1 Tax=Larkinella bovis TaxID=683041 RepID=A0ABW0II74_9BACT